ncbi:DUF1858 domain-containing protein [bacterium]|nr:DUF1858 domain-containing protein [bacterium]
MRKEITKDTLLCEILDHPKAKEILAKYNLPCLSCPMVGFEMGILKIGQVCKMYDIDLEGLLKKINENIKK